VEAPMPPEVENAIKRTETCMFNFMNPLFILMVLCTLMLAVKKGIKA